MPSIATLAEADGLAHSNPAPGALHPEHAVQQRVGHARHRGTRLDLLQRERACRQRVAVASGDTATFRVLNNDFPIQPLAESVVAMHDTLGQMDEAGCTFVPLASV